MVRSRVALMAVGTVVLLAANANAASHVFVSIGVGIPAPVVVAAPPPVVVAAPPPPPPAPVIVAAPPAPYVYGYVWRPAYYVWTGYGYQLMPGAWVRPPYARAVWVAPHWEAYHGHGDEDEDGDGHGYGYGHGHGHGDGHGNGFGHSHGSVWVPGYWRY